MLSPPRTYPDTDQGWRERYHAETGRDPDEMLTPAQVAELIHVKLDTIYQYRRYGNIPVPDLQTGGREPEPGELITWRGRSARGTRTDLLATQRRPRPGELLHPYRIGWYAWRIHRWIAQERKGRGAWGKGPRRYADRDRTAVGPGEWVPPVT